MKTIKLLKIFILFAATFSTLNKPLLAATDDSDLTGISTPRTRSAVRNQTSQLPLENVSFKQLDQNQVGLQIIFKAEPVSNVEVKYGKTILSTDSSGEALFSECFDNESILITFRNPYFKLNNSSGKTYFISTPIKCGQEAVLEFTTTTIEDESTAGQALSIWTLSEKARQKLAATVGLKFWTEPLEWVWPADGDYYSSQTISITKGHHWDVVGHEMGHAIYDLGGLGTFGGGPHKIDECYSKDLALSEGWATYFSGWLSLDLDGEDPHFEFLVPRRAPIQIENIPADVCLGESNEWRVAGFFWDAIDSHNDAEISQYQFAQVWRALENSRASSASAAIQLMIKANMDSNKLNEAWTKNFGTR